MEKEIALQLIEEAITKLQQYSPTEKGSLQELVNCRFRATEIANYIFGEDNSHSKIINQANLLNDPNRIKYILINELESMFKILTFGGSANGKSVPNFEWSLIHTDIINVSKEKFEHGHYADSVESAYKEINARIKDFYKRKKGEELDGVSLMRNVFFTKCSDTPLIVLDDLTTVSGRDIQEGYGHIFAGSMQGIRNPSAHANLDMSYEKSVHLLFLASLLMFLIDDRLN